MHAWGVQHILIKGGDILKKNHEGLTPAMFAVLTGRTEVLKWILENAKNTEDVPDGGILNDKNRMVTSARIWWDVCLEGGGGWRRAGAVYSDSFACHSDFTDRM